jgi:hypothetical protein
LASRTANNKLLSNNKKILKKLMNFTQIVQKELDHRLKKLGFKKKQYYFYKQWDENTYLTVGFGIASFLLPGHRLVSPNIGICYVDVNRLCEQLSGREITNNIYPTVGKGLGYIMPENTFKEWDFVENKDNTGTYDDMFNAITTYGFAYFTGKDRHSIIVDSFKNREKAPHQILSISYFLNGEKEKGLQIFNEFLERMSHRPTDEEIRRGKKAEEVVILRSGESNATAEDMQKMLQNLPSGGQMVIVGAGYNGNIDPTYLKFIENYKLL